MDIIFVVNAHSYKYVTNAVDYIYQVISNIPEYSISLVLADSVDQVVIPEGALVLLVGESFGRFRRQKGCIYAFLNYSVILPLGNPFRQSLDGIKAMRRKYLMLQDKIDLLDAVLDYYPEQVTSLRKKLPCLVLGFPTGILVKDSSEFIPIAKRSYDVCFVGGLSKRRSYIRDCMLHAGLTVSPANGVVVEDIAKDSRITLNVHKHRTNHLEYPRVFGALASGSALVTEESYGLYTNLSPNLLVAARYGAIVRSIKNLVTDEERITLLALNGSDWMAGAWAKHCEESWVNILKRLSEVPPR
jgi:hypothetical protein